MEEGAPHNSPQAALQELIRVLRSPSSPSQQQQVLNILRSNPALMAAFVRQRAARNQGGQGGPRGAGGPPPGGPAGGRFQGPGAMQGAASHGIRIPTLCRGAESNKLKMEEGAADGSTPADPGPGPAPPSPAEARRLSIQRCIQSLVHACQCQSANCSLPSCQKMKRVVQHTKGCKRKTNGCCRICKQLIALCCYHAKHCQENSQENKCPVPFCLNIKHKLRQRRLQQAQMRRRRMARDRRGRG